MPIVTCSHCGIKFTRESKRYNEAKICGWKQFCSRKCQSLNKCFQIECICSRLGCNNTFKRMKKEYKKSSEHYCSCRCAAIVNNNLYPRKQAPLKKCSYCSKYFKGNGRKYCSTNCQHMAVLLSGEKIIQLIKDFEKIHCRIPTKREFNHYTSIRESFGNWNNAIKAAGYEPNPVMFAKKHTANDGHICDSLSEKIIDDWLFSRNIPHQHHIQYPGNKKYIADFKVGDNWIEFFGLDGQLYSYDILKRRKIYLAIKYKLKLIKIFPRDVFPINKLDIILKDICLVK